MADVDGGRAVWSAAWIGVAAVAGGIGGTLLNSVLTTGPRVLLWPVCGLGLIMLGGFYLGFAVLRGWWPASGAKASAASVIAGVRHETASRLPSSGVTEIPSLPAGSFSPPAVSRPKVDVDDVPQQPPSLQPRTELVAELDQAGPGVATYGLDDPSLGDLDDPGTQLIIELLSRRVSGIPRISALLEAARLSPEDYPLETAKLTWTAAVPDAAKRGQLRELIAHVVGEDAAFRTEFNRRWQSFVTPSDVWYHHDDPYTSCFVSAGASRAVIDRAGLRSGLHDLATDQYWVLVILGKVGSGRSHSWFLVAHLRDAGVLIGMNDFVRVTTQDWVGEYTGEDLVRSLAGRLGMNIELTPSEELDDARTRKLVDVFVGRYIAERSKRRDDVIRWIFLDGLDRPGVQNSARDVAKRLITMVDEGELEKTRLIITGLDGIGLTFGPSVKVEEIPSIDKTLVRSFLGDVAAHLGRNVTSQELDKCVAEVLGTGELRDVGNRVVQLAKTRWVRGA
jgi:hypothetical protein